MKPIGLVLAAMFLSATSALAQERVFRTVEAAVGKEARLGLIGNVSKDCKPGPKPEVKVLTAPKHGALSIRSGKSPAGTLARCPKLAVPAEGVFYTANPKSGGTDEVVYGVKRADGRNELVTVKITITEKAKPQPKADGTTDL